MLNYCNDPENNKVETPSTEKSLKKGVSVEPESSAPLLQIKQTKESLTLLARNSFHSKEIPVPDVNDSSKKSFNSVNSSPLNLLNKKSTKIKPQSPNNKERRSSRTLLHPDHAKLIGQKTSFPPVVSLEQRLFKSTSIASLNGDLITSPQSLSVASSASTITGGVPGHGSKNSDFCVNCESRSSGTTNKCSILDALDLEYALIKAATRGSIGPYSLSRSLQKLTFTQSLAFPALAKGLSSKRNSSPPSDNQSTIRTFGSGMNAFAKVMTVLVLMLTSFLVFGVLYKYIRT